MTEDPLWPRASAWFASGGSTEPGAPSMAVLGVPLSQASISPSGAYETPAALRAALRRFSTYDADAGVDVGQVAVTDLGDLPVASMTNEAAQRTVADAVADLAGQWDLLVLVGGDNSITRPGLAGLAGQQLHRMGLLTLDAHHDVRGFHAGPTNGTPVRGLIEDGLPGDQVVQIGLGTFTNAPAHREYVEQAGVTTMTVAEARKEGVGACVARHLDWLAQHCDGVYVDLDVDVLDSAYAPGCPGARPGGLNPAELHDAAHSAGRHPSVIAVDVVEVDATVDHAGRTVDAAAQCLLRVASGLGLRP